MGEPYYSPGIFGRVTTLLTRDLGRDNDNYSPRILGRMTIALIWDFRHYYLLIKIFSRVASFFFQWGFYLIVFTHFVI